MSKLATITRPQLHDNKGQGCSVARRNSSFFGTFNVDYLVHSNNLLTHTHTHTHTHLDVPTVYHLLFSFVFAREKRRVISIQRGDATKQPFCFRMPVSQHQYPKIHTFTGSIYREFYKHVKTLKDRKYEKRVSKTKYGRHLHEGGESTTRG